MSNAAHNAPPLLIQKILRTFETMKVYAAREPGDYAELAQRLVILGMIADGAIEYINEWPGMPAKTPAP
jgi:hypothetical protein